jgi:hypothetical protein
MVVYANVLTRGLPAKDAREFGALIRYMAGSGQTSGTAVGQLPAGYLPLTKANGLAALAAYAQRVASAVSAQTGAVPSLTPTTSGGSGTGSGGAGSGGSGVPGGGPTTSGPSPGGTGSPSSTPIPSSSGINAVSLGTTGALDVGAGGLVLPALLLLAAVFALVGAAEVVLGVRGRRQ